ncbi:hypothetical protein AURDEDRAFT_123988 [Auricularia subglabra TFB-10046 SS5]|nr:hypothetical protein AURDEDRAFT_123988 [Auricularia subglabra TFB-10046 SS5]
MTSQSFSNSFAVLDAVSDDPGVGELHPAPTAAYSDAELVTTTANALSPSSSTEAVDEMQVEATRTADGTPELAVYVPETQIAPANASQPQSSVSLADSTTSTTVQPSSTPAAQLANPPFSPMHEQGRRKRGPVDSPSVVTRVAKRAIKSIGSKNQAADARRRPVRETNATQITANDLSLSALDRLQVTEQRATMTLTDEEIKLIFNMRRGAATSEQPSIYAHPAAVANRSNWRQGPPAEAATTSRNSTNTNDPFQGSQGFTFSLHSNDALVDYDSDVQHSPTPPPRKRGSTSHPQAQATLGRNPINLRALAEANDRTFAAAEAERLARRGNREQSPMDLTGSSPPAHAFPLRHPVKVEEDEQSLDGLSRPIVNVDDFEQTSTISRNGSPVGLPRHLIDPLANAEEQRKSVGISPVYEGTTVAVKAIGRMTPIPGASRNEHMQGVGPTLREFLCGQDSTVVPFRPVSAGGRPVSETDADVVMALVVYNISRSVKGKYPNMNLKVIQAYSEKTKDDDPDVLPYMLFLYNMPDELADTLQGARGWVFGCLAGIAYKDIEDRSPYVMTMQGFFTNDRNLVKAAFIRQFLANAAVRATIENVANEFNYDVRMLHQELANRVDVVPYEVIKPGSHGTLVVQFHISLDSSPLSDEVHVQLKADCQTIIIKDPAVGNSTIFHPWECSCCFASTHPGGMCPLLLLARGTTVAEELAAALERALAIPAPRAGKAPVKPAVQNETATKGDKKDKGGWKKTKAGRPSGLQHSEESDYNIQKMIRAKLRCIRLQHPENIRPGSVVRRRLKPKAGSNDRPLAAARRRLPRPVRQPDSSADSLTHAGETTGPITHSSTFSNTGDTDRHGILPSRARGTPATPAWRRPEDGDGGTDSRGSPVEGQEGRAGATSRASSNGRTTSATSPARGSEAGDPWDSPGRRLRQGEDREPQLKRDGRTNKNTKPGLTIASENMRGKGSRRIAGNPKWQKIVASMRRDKIGVMALQETHLTDAQVIELNSTYKNIQVFNTAVPGSETKAGGVALVFNRFLTNALDAECHVVVPGRAIIVDFRWHREERLAILAVYAPTDSNENAELWKKIESSLRDKRKKLPKPSIMLGDFNFVEDPIDRFPAHMGRMDAPETFDTLKTYLRVVDGWRLTHPDKSEWTWRNRARTAMSRIDRIYLQAPLLAASRKWDISISDLNTNDHSRIVAEVVHLDAPEMGKGRWAMPPSLAEDAAFLEEANAICMTAQAEMEARAQAPRMADCNVQTIWAKLKADISTAARAFVRAKEGKRRSAEIRQKKEREGAKDEVLRALTEAEKESAEARLAKAELQIYRLKANDHKKRSAWKRALADARAETMSGEWFSWARDTKKREVMHSMLIPGSNPARHVTDSKAMADIAGRSPRKRKLK